LDFLFLHASEQYFTSPQFLAQDFLQVISFLQTRQILLGKNDLLPLKLVNNCAGYRDYWKAEYQSSHKSWHCFKVWFHHFSFWL